MHKRLYVCSMTLTMYAVFILQKDLHANYFLRFKPILTTSLGLNISQIINLVNIFVYH